MSRLIKLGIVFGVLAAMLFLSPGVNYGDQIKLTTIMPKTIGGGYNPKWISFGGNPIPLGWAQALPMGGGTVSYSIPTVHPVGGGPGVPTSAKEILVNVSCTYVKKNLSGNSPAAETWFYIWTSESGVDYKVFFLVDGYRSPLSGNNTTVFWLPVTAERKVYVAGIVGAFDMSVYEGGSWLYIVGYR